MGAWGYGLFESDHDLDIVSNLDGEAGVRGLDASKNSDKSDKYLTIHGGGDDPDRVRAHLDSGILDKLLAEKERNISKKSGDDFWDPKYVFCLLGACAMTLGCRISPDHFSLIKKHFLYAGMMEAAEREMFKALNGPGTYKEGTPYVFEVPEDVNEAIEAGYEAQLASGKSFIGLNVPAPHGFFKDPEKNKERRAMMEEGKYGASACGGCGKEHNQESKEMARCAACSTRRYCDKDCQKAHWKVHKKMCSKLKGHEGSEMQSSGNT